MLCPWLFQYFKMEIQNVTIWLVFVNPVTYYAYSKSTSVNISTYVLKAF